MTEEAEREKREKQVGEVMGRVLDLAEAVGAKKERRRIVALVRSYADIYDDATKGVLLRLAERIDKGEP